MKYRILNSISYEPPGRALEIYWPGDTADLSGWPGLERLEALGAIVPIEEPQPEPEPPSKPRRAAPVLPSKEELA